MGINLRSESKDTSSISKEIRYRVWWSIYTLENTLSIMTGRPTSGADRFCTTPLPVPFQEEQFQDSNVSRLLEDYHVRSVYTKAITSKTPKSTASSDSMRPGLPTGQRPAPPLTEIVPNNSLYFLHFVDLTLIMRRAIDLLYAPGFAQQPWLQVHAAVVDLIAETDAWLSILPDIFQFTSGHDTQLFERQRSSLAFRFYSTKITISRPSLCRSDRQQSGNEASSPRQRKTSKTCIESACQLLNLLPDEPNVIWLIQVSPWWCVLHYLMQAVTVLLIELDFRLKYTPDEVGIVSTHVEKAMRWLLSMGADSTAAQRAWAVCDGIYSHLSPKLAVEPNEIPNDSGVPTDDDDVRYPYAAAAHPPPMDPTLDIAMGGTLFTPEYTHLPQNMVVHPILQTVYDEFLPCDLSQDSVHHPSLRR
jgi:hypothetical protein